MINIITGEIDSGKTSHLRELYNHLSIGSGYLLTKFYYRGRYAGQNLLDLPDKNDIPFSRLVEYIPEHWQERYRYDYYSFSSAGIDKAKLIIRKIIENKERTAFIDEIGPLELLREGIYYDFRELINNTENIYVTIRKECINDVIDTFNLINYKITQLE